MNRRRIITAPFTGNCGSKALRSRPPICGSRPSFCSIRSFSVPVTRILTCCRNSHASRGSKSSLCQSFRIRFAFAWIPFARRRSLPRLASHILDSVSPRCHGVLRFVVSLVRVIVTRAQMQDVFRKMVFKTKDGGMSVFENIVIAEVPIHVDPILPFHEGG
jgi:hypothetical protein